MNKFYWRITVKKKNLAHEPLICHKEISLSAPEQFTPHSQKLETAYETKSNTLLINFFEQQ